MKQGVKFSFILALATLAAWSCPFTSFWVGAGVAGGLIASDWAARRYTPRGIGLVLIGLLIGYLIAQVILLLLTTVLGLASLAIPPATLQLVKLVTLLTAIYWGCATTLAAGTRWHLELPFLALKQAMPRPRCIWLDASAIADPRLLDLAATGILDRRCVLWHGVLVDLQGQLDALDELTRTRARRSLDTIKKLLEIERLGLRVDKTPMPPRTEARCQMAHLVRQLDDDILTGDLSQLQSAAFEGVAFVNLHALSNALKPLTKTGEFLQLKVLRQGKEASQGVGYLEDGTMVVVNGAGDWIGEEVRTRVLSVKHSSAGRIVFCNLLENRANESERGSCEAAYRN